MAEIERLNGVIRAWEQGRPVFSSFVKAERQAGIDAAGSPFDSVVYEMEHNPWDIIGLGDSLQYLLDRKQVVAGGLAPKVTPLCRIPPNGSEMNQAYAKQALDRGVYGIVWPHISSVEQAYNAVAATRYPRPKTAPNYEPEGIRGDAPTAAVRYWGVSQQEYYNRADVWPLNPKGELLVFLMIEDVKGMAALDDILKDVPGIGCVLIGEGDLSQELGIARQYEHPILKEAMGQIVATCKKHQVRVGHPHVTAKNVEQVLADGYSFLMSMPVKTYTAVDKAKAVLGIKSEASGPQAAY